MSRTTLIALLATLALPGCIFDGARASGDAGTAVYGGPAGGSGGGSSGARTADDGRGTTDPGSRFTTTQAPIGGLTVETAPLDLAPSRLVDPVSPAHTTPNPGGTPPPPPPPPLDPRVR